MLLMDIRPRFFYLLDYVTCRSEKLELKMKNNPKDTYITAKQTVTEALYFNNTFTKLCIRFNFQFQLHLIGFSFLFFSDRRSEKYQLV